MGCCCSKVTDQLFKSTLDFQPLSGSETTSPIQEESNQLDTEKEDVAKQREEHVELVFRSKRTNVFAKGYDGSKEIQLKVIPKTKRQAHIIRSAIASNFIFASLSEDEIRSVVDAMEILPVIPEQTIITQGEEGDYFYIIEHGLFTVIVDDAAVTKIGDGKSFGELALLNNSTRAATIRADMEGCLFTLDRDTFRYTLAKSSASKHKVVLEALSKVPLLKDLFDHQLAKIADAVEIVPYNPGDYIIRKGAEGNVFYIVKEGNVKVCDIGEKAQFVDHILKPGDYFGERALITGEPRAANVIAEPTCKKVEVMALDRTAFNSLLGPLKEVIDNNMNLNMLRTIKLFKDLTEDERGKVVRSFGIKEYSPGQQIIREGDQGHEFFIMKMGEAKVLIHGKEVGALQTGTYFGEMALLDDEVRKATVVASSPCECFVLDRSTFTRILGSLKDILKRDVESRKKDLEIVKNEMKSEGDSKDKKGAKFRGHVNSNGLPDPTDGRNTTKLRGVCVSDLIHIGLLGTGKFARVSLTQHKKTKELYALKMMSKREIMVQKQQVNVLHERVVLEQLDFPFVLALYATFADASKLYMLLEFVQGGELFSLIHGVKHDGLPASHAKFYSIVIVITLEYLHSKDIAYRDLKPENILIDRDGYPKIVDFGFAKSLKAGAKTFTLCGTPEYLAPEIVLGRGYTRAVDWWALGVLLYEMIAGQSPFADADGQDQSIICRNIIDGRIVFPTEFDSDCRDLIKRLLSKEIQSRIGNLRGGGEDVKDHRWYANINNPPSRDMENPTQERPIFNVNQLIMNKTLTAPWIPKIRNASDISNFDPYDDNESVMSSGTYTVSNANTPAKGSIDNALWEKDFPVDQWSYAR